LRQIGTVPKAIDPKVFADYLLTLGIKTRLDDRPDGWHLWIYHEDHVARAGEELKAFLSQPDDPRYRSAVDAAEVIRRRELERDKEFRKNFREVSDQWAYPTFRRRPLTFLLVALCVVVFVLQESPATSHEVESTLFFSTAYVGQDGEVHGTGLEEILHGQVWRLVTPAIMHANIIHIFFNMWWLVDLGTLIEVRRGTLRLAILVVLSAIVSNCAQYAWMEHVEPGEPHFFLGMSGVVYALFGYVWMKGLYHPEQGMTVHPNTVSIMLIWLFFCMTGAIGPIGNAAHFMGLAAGVALGVLRY
jgi:GlpG protein